MNDIMIYKMKKEKIKKIYNTRFIRMYEYDFADGKQYFWASRRDSDRLVASMTDQEQKSMLADAVSCFVVLNIKGQPKKLLLNWEYRYPVGQYMLSVPAGIVDPEDYDSPYALEDTAVRELREETGIQVGPTDTVTVVNPAVFSTPGMTDESNALVYISINRDHMPDLTQDLAEGTEHFEGFRLVSKDQAEKFIMEGRDDHGNYYPLFTWAALMFFLGIK